MSVTLAEMVVILPILILSLGALGVLLLDVFEFDFSRHGLALTTIFASFLAIVFLPTYIGEGHTVFSGMLYADPMARVLALLICGGAFLTVGISARFLRSEQVNQLGEYYALLLIATAGAIVFATAAELITLFLGLETMSMALYAMCGAALSIRRSAESALKYFLLGSFSSAFLLYGIALIYGATGSTSIPAIAIGLDQANQMVGFLALGFLLVGLVFKVGAVPFHFWAPDVYQGAPTPVTVYMACVIKISAIGAILRVLWIAFEHYTIFWAGVIWTIALLTMLFGNLIALRQRSMKRMLAYSSIAHAGYLMVGVLVPYSDTGGGVAVLFYLVVYTAMTAGAFGIVLALSAHRASEVGGDDITRFNGLASRRPLIAALMALFMFALAGLPPGVAGLVGKFYIFSAAIKADYVGLAVVGVLCSAVSCYYYLRVIVAMYFVDPDPQEAPPAELGAYVIGALAACGVAVVILGVMPTWLYQGMARVMLAF